MRETDLINIMERLERVEKRVGFQERLESGGEEFLPTDIASILLWYDFQDYSRMFTDAGSTRVFSNSALIYQVNDKSGNGDHATQSTSGARPAYTQILNDLSASLYDGAADYMIGPTNVDLSDGFSIFAIVRPTSAQAQQIVSIVSGATGNNRLQFYVLADGTLGARAFQTGGTYTYMGRKSNTSQISINNTYLVEAYYDGGVLASGIKVFANGSQVDTADDSSGTFTGIPSTTDVPFYVGCQFISGAISNAFSGYIMETIVFNAEISAADKTSMRTYLNDKWKIY